MLCGTRLLDQVRVQIRYKHYNSRMALGHATALVIVRWRLCSGERADRFGPIAAINVVTYMWLD